MSTPARCITWGCCCTLVLQEAKSQWLGSQVSRSVQFALFGHCDKHVFSIAGAAEHRQHA